MQQQQRYSTTFTYILTTTEQPIRPTDRQPDGRTCVGQPASRPGGRRDGMQSHTARCGGVAARLLCNARDCLEWMVGTRIAFCGMWLSTVGRLLFTNSLLPQREGGRSDVFFFFFFSFLTALQSSSSLPCGWGLCWSVGMLLVASDALFLLARLPGQRRVAMYLPSAGCTQSEACAFSLLTCLVQTPTLRRCPGLQPLHV
ncbi:uncharacterized protein J3D65DRAFT_37153 [Phyllosticta citribraziliensis]|uniref:Uncharacterized protein n=1 Tax=Phyllosticta citribraziliensis TaxID=989973 RepID=A0ABR1MDC4_9PEZI